jgi:hypothetical protein
VVKKESDYYGLGKAGEHVMKHHFDSTIFKKKSAADNLKEAILSANKKKEGE